ncbi:caspase Dronc [Topomyia yanbarensis]|uniref:caspase Dronc n=1 Tax=Topomyia yanbarensis TaxID=2498891 RepID=UPI00273C5C3E|nr:caspase Dronc [Topomyia yanbarensis]
MNQMERQTILRQMDQLIQKTNYEILRNECYNRRMLSEVMVVIIEHRYPDEATKHKKLFEKITKRGPTAFQTLLEICQKDFPDAYALLKPGNPPSSGTSSGNNNGQEKYRSTFNPNRPRSISANLGDSSRSVELQRKLRNLSIGSRSVSEEDDLKNNNSILLETTDKGIKCQLEVFEEKCEDLLKVELTTRPQRHRLLQAYEMRSRNRGVVFILNVITYINNTHPVRNGARTDKNNLVSLFRQLGFTVFYYEDLTRADFVDLIEQLKASDHLSTECFAFYVLAHGNHTKGRDKIYLHDNSVLFVEEILVHFNNANCRKLIRKPKLFFFSICRGDQADYGTLRPSEHTERDGMINLKKDPPTNMPTFADMFICFSTVPGFAAHRDLHNGSWFVESMCEVWAKHAHDTDVEQLMKLVGKHASLYRTEQNNALQTLASEQRGFFDVLYLNPGYNAD